MSRRGASWVCTSKGGTEGVLEFICGSEDVAGCVMVEGYLGDLCRGSMRVLLGFVVQLRSRASIFLRAAGVLTTYYYNNV